MPSFLMKVRLANSPFAICVVSYLAQSGSTLNVVLNLLDYSTVAIASNEKDWLPAHGSFEVMP